MAPWSFRVLLGLEGEVPLESLVERGGIALERRDPHVGVPCLDAGYGGLRRMHECSDFGLAEADGTAPRRQGLDELPSSTGHVTKTGEHRIMSPFSHVRCRLLIA